MTDWNKLIRLTAPALVGAAAGGQHGAVMRGFLGEQDRIDQERRQRAQQDAHKRELGAKTSLELLSSLQNETDPLRFEQLRGAIANHADALGVDPSMFDGLQAPDGSVQRLKELTDAIGGLKGYDLDQLAESGASLKLKDGSTIPVSDALRATRQYPIDQTGKPVLPPAKADANASTDYGRFISRYAKDRNKKVEALTAAEELDARKQFNTVDDKPVDPLTASLRTLQIEGQRLRNRKLAGGDAPKVDPNRATFIQQILDNPSIYDSLTPTERTAIAPDLAAKGFGFGKPLSESAISKMSESRSALLALHDLRDTLKSNEQYIGPVAGFSALNPYSDARKAQADIDRVKQRVGKALEGGVLRKEDEEKYKKILATLNDTPSTAIYKIDQIILSLENDLKSFEDEQKRAGRRVNSPKQPAAPFDSSTVRPMTSRGGGQRIGKYEVVSVSGK
jgi:hypothetical protein